jgi:carbohydrate diacid regulator
LFFKNTSVFTVLVNEKICTVVKEFENLTNIEDINNEVTIFANSLLENIKVENDVNICIGIGSLFRKLKDIEISYKDAQMALLIGDIFYEDRKIFNYKKLGIGRLIYHLPKTICKIYLEENFQSKICDIFDIDIINTFEKLCEYNFNLSEASKALFVHRNTLIYRIEKIKEATNLDLRNFEDAVIFKISTMANKYMQKMESNNIEYIDN